MFRTDIADSMASADSSTPLTVNGTGQILGLGGNTSADPSKLAFQPLFAVILFAPNDTNPFEFAAEAFSLRGYPQESKAVKVQIIFLAVAFGLAIVGAVVAVGLRVWTRTFHMVKLKTEIGTYYIPNTAAFFSLFLLAFILTEAATIFNICVIELRTSQYNLLGLHLIVWVPLWIACWSIISGAMFNADFTRLSRSRDGPMPLHLPRPALTHAIVYGVPTFFFVLILIPLSLASSQFNSAFSGFVDVRTALDDSAKKWDGVRPRLMTLSQSGIFAQEMSSAAAYGSAMTVVQVTSGLLALLYWALSMFSLPFFFILMRQLKTKVGILEREVLPLKTNTPYPPPDPAPATSISALPIPSVGGLKEAAASGSGSAEDLRMRSESLRVALRKVKLQGLVVNVISVVSTVVNAANTFSPEYIVQFGNRAGVLPRTLAFLWLFFVISSTALMLICFRRCDATLLRSKLGKTLHLVRPSRPGSEDGLEGSQDVDDVDGGQSQGEKTKRCPTMVRMTGRGRNDSRATLADGIRGVEGFTRDEGKVVGGKGFESAGYEVIGRSEAAPFEANVEAETTSSYPLRANGVNGDSDPDSTVENRVVSTEIPALELDLSTMRPGSHLWNFFGGDLESAEKSMRSPTEGLPESREEAVGGKDSDLGIGEHSVVESGPSGMNDSEGDVRGSTGFGVAGGGPRSRSGSSASSSVSDASAVEGGRASGAPFRELEVGRTVTAKGQKAEEPEPEPESEPEPEFEPEPVGKMSVDSVTKGGIHSLDAFPIVFGHPNSPSGADGLLRGSGPRFPTSAVSFQ